MSTGIKVFFSYAYEDKDLCEKLETHLSQLKRQGVINTWHNCNISPGIEWKSEIERHLNTAQVILLFVSPDFIASERCYSVEMKRAIERHKRGEVRVIPILLRPGNSWKDTPLNQLQILPINRQPITDWHSQDKAFSVVAEYIKEVVQELREQPKSQKDKLQEKSKGTILPHNKKKDHPSVAPPAHDRKVRFPATPSSKVGQSGQHTNNQTNTVYRDQIQLKGGVNNITINNAYTPNEDAIAKGLNDTKRGYKALWNQDYIVARRCLESANLALSGSELPTEAAQIKYYLAIALLNGQRPFHVMKTMMQDIEQMLNSAIKLRSLHSYYYTLALFKHDFSRNGLSQYKREAQSLLRKAQRIGLVKTDAENLQLLKLCQRDLINVLAKEKWIQL